MVVLLYPVEVVGGRAVVVVGGLGSMVIKIMTAAFDLNQIEPAMGAIRSIQ